MRKTFNRLIITILYCCLVILWLWSSTALYFIALPNQKLGFVASGLFAITIPLLYFLLPPRKLALFIVSLLCIAVIALWSKIQPGNDRDWKVSVARSPYAVTKGNLITIYNIRNFDYQTEHDFIENHYQKTYALDELETLSFILSYWDGGTLFAHTILSFGFKNGDYLAVSAETRLEKGESQGGLAGLFKQYEMIYVLADERDILRLRSNFRKEEVYVYPVRITKEKTRKIFDVIISRVNQLYKQPEFYNTLTHNCFTSLRADVSKVTRPQGQFDWRIIANGYADEMLYENQTLDTGLSFPEAKEFYHINQYVAENNEPGYFSSKIRPNEPGRTRR